VRPDRRAWTAFRSSPPPPELRTAHVDFLLRFVLDRNAAAPHLVSARLDALERTLSELTRQWRQHPSFAPARELRLSRDTLASLLAWLEAPGDPQPSDLARLGVYASGALTDGDVPAGWLRVHLG
jgi:hypothetical protein